MKTLKFMMIGMAVAAMSLFASCDKGNDEPKSVTKNYAGTMQVNAGLFGENVNAHAKLVTTGNKSELTLNNVSVDIPAPLNVTLEIGDVTIKNIANNAGVLTEGDEQTIIVQMPAPMNTMYPNGVPVKVSLSTGAVTNSTLTFALDIKETPAPMPIVVTFNGNEAVKL